MSGYGGATAGYEGAAAMQQAYSYGAATMAGYGGAYNMAAGYGGAAPAGAAGGMQQMQGGAGMRGPGQDSSFSESGYGAYRGHGAQQGRVDRSYRPY
jgi:hypothetical protein